MTFRNGARCAIRTNRYASHMVKGTETTKWISRYSSTVSSMTLFKYETALRCSAVAIATGE